MVAIAPLRFQQILRAPDDPHPDVLLGLDRDGQVWAYDPDSASWDPVSMRPSTPDVPHAPFAEGATVVDRRRLAEDQVGMVIGRGMAQRSDLDAVPYTVVRFKGEDVTYLGPDDAPRG